jgi:hypothetical protein
MFLAGRAGGELSLSLSLPHSGPELWHFCLLYELVREHSILYSILRST